MATRVSTGNEGLYRIVREFYSTQARINTHLLKVILIEVI